jgi:cytidyltransferase-like protein
LAVVSQEDLILQRQAWKRNGLGVVCVAGAFDLLHPGHVRLLEQARGLADKLVVVIESDARMRESTERTKKGAAAGTARPVNPEGERAEVVAALVSVDAVTVAGAELEKFLAELKPDVYAIGVADTDRPPAAAPLIDPGWAKYAKLAQIPVEPGFSTALLLEKIQQTHA